MKEIQQVFVVFYSDFQANLHPQRCRVIFNKLRPDTNCSALELHLIEPELTLITRKFAETILTSYFFRSSDVVFAHTPHGLRDPEHAAHSQ